MPSEFNRSQRYSRTEHFVLRAEDLIRQQVGNCCMADAKLDEELAEYHKDQSIEELADLLEVICAATKARGYTLEQLETVRAGKAATRGAFEKKLLFQQETEVIPCPVPSSARTSQNECGCHRQRRQHRSANGRWGRGNFRRTVMRWPLSGQEKPRLPADLQWHLRLSQGRGAGGGPVSH